MEEIERDWFYSKKNKEIKSKRKRKGKKKMNVTQKEIYRDKKSEYHMKEKN